MAVKICLESVLNPRWRPINPWQELTSPVSSRLVLACSGGNLRENFKGTRCYIFLESWSEIGVVLWVEIKAILGHYELVR